LTLGLDPRVHAWSQEELLGGAPQPGTSRLPIALKKHAILQCGCKQTGCKMQESNRNENSRSPAPTEVQTDKARAGVTGHNVRYVLGFSLAGAVVAVAIVGYLVTHGWLGAV